MDRAIYAAPGLQPRGPAPTGRQYSRAGWLACPRVPGTGEQEKVLYRSDNDGVTWVVDGSTSPPQPDQTPSASIIPIGGYITQFAVLTPDLAYLALGRGSPVETVNGGKTWTVAASNFDSGALGVVLAPISPTNSVALVAGQIWATDNGTTWAPTT